MTSKEQFINLIKESLMNSSSVQDAQIQALNIMMVMSMVAMEDMNSKLHNNDYDDFIKSMRELHATVMKGP